MPKLKISISNMLAKGDERVTILQILPPLELLEVLEEVVGLDATTIPGPIFEYSPSPINCVRVDPASFALDVGILGKLTLLVVHVVMTKPQVFGDLLVHTGAIRIENGAPFDVLGSKNTQPIISTRRPKSPLPIRALFDLIVVFEDQKAAPLHRPPPRRHL